jgi:hypothetical protein
MSAGNLGPSNKSASNLTAQLQPTSAGHSACNGEGVETDAAGLSRRSLLRLAGVATVTAAVWSESTDFALAQATGVDGTAVYASNYGVTGVNNGSRDDTPLLQKAYAAAIAAGANALILPQGDVYCKSYTQDGNYPYSYVIRCAANDFKIIVPDGCTVHCTVIDDGQHGTTATNYWSLFQFTGSRSGITGGGHFVHATPGYSGSTPNNYVAVSHLTSTSVDCYQLNLTADGFTPSIGVFDNSSSYTGFQALLRVRTCQCGVIQSNAATTTRPFMFGCQVSDYYAYGIGFAGTRVCAGNLRVDDVHGFSASVSAALAIWGVGAAVNINGVTLMGPYTSATAANGRHGLKVVPSVFTAGSAISISNYGIEGFDYALQLVATVNQTILTNGNIRYCGFLIDKDQGSGYHCADTFFNGLIADSIVYGFSQNAQFGSSTEGNFHLNGGVRITNIGNAWLATGSIISSGDVFPVPPIAYNYKVQLVVPTSGNTVVATGGIDGLVLQLAPAGTLATLAVAWPTSAVDGQSFTLKSSQAVTALTVIGSVAGAPSALTAGYSRTFLWNNTASAWL